MLGFGVEQGGFVQFGALGGFGAQAGQLLIVAALEISLGVLMGLSFGVEIMISGDRVRAVGTESVSWCHWRAGGEGKNHLKV